MSNTDQQSLGFVDGYIASDLANDARGIASMGYLFAAPRLVIDRLAPGGRLLSIGPDRPSPQRWPLLPLADWRAGRIPRAWYHRMGRSPLKARPTRSSSGASRPTRRT